MGRCFWASIPTRSPSLLSPPRSKSLRRAASMSCSMPRAATRLPRSSRMRFSPITGVERQGLADGIVITPSHNPPRFGGFKYNPPHGGPAGAEVTRWIEQRANAILSDGLRDVSRVPFERALKAETTHRHNYIESYVDDLPSVVDIKLI